MEANSIVRIIRKYLSGRFSPETEEKVQRWIIKDKYPEEKEKASLAYWNEVEAKSDTDTYLALERVNKRIGHQKMRPLPLRPKIGRVAAVLIPLFIITGGYLYHISTRNHLIEISAAYGEKKHLLLPDSSEIWLNAGTVIKYPKRFSDSQRTVHLNGEAYFSVKKDAAHPFIVNTPQLSVKVLGTKFYVTSTLKEKDFMVSLIEGSVKISSGEKSAMLKPGYRAQFKDGEFKQSVIRTFETELWKDGIYYFKDKSFDELMEGFEKCFGVKISIDKDIKSTERYTGKFYRYNGIQHALQALQHDFNFDFKWDKELNTIQITSKHK